MPFPSPEDLPDPGIEPRSPTLQADALPSEPPGNIMRNPGLEAQAGIKILHHNIKIPSRRVNRITGINLSFYNFNFGGTKGKYFFF